MEHADHVALLRDGIGARGGAWADFGAGRGAFTLALADLLGPRATIYAIDRNAGDLRRNAEAMAERFPATTLHTVTADFSVPIDVPVLDGAVMANSLHFVRDQQDVVERVRGYLRPGARLLVVEYSIERANAAVPHPVPFARWEQLARDAGFEDVELLRRRPSRTFAEIYSAMAR